MIQENTRMRISSFLLCALALVGAEHALAQTANQTPSQTPNAAAPVAATPAPAPVPIAPAGTAGSVPADYVIGPGDTVQVFVWRNPELSVTVPVRPDGKISTPLVEDMVAIGKTPSQLARDIEVVLAEYVRQPTVNVIVSQAVSTFRQVRVVGQVRQSQSVAYRDGLTVLDVILAVGGVNEFAAPNRARIVRSKDGQQTEIRVRLGDLLDKGDLRQNVLLQPGDVLVVPESLF
jgi:polysaccharide export outer membrane protein